MLIIYLVASLFILVLPCLCPADFTLRLYNFRDALHLSTDRLTFGSGVLLGSGWLRRRCVFEVRACLWYAWLRLSQVIDEV